MWARAKRTNVSNTVVTGKDSVKRAKEAAIATTTGTKRARPGAADDEDDDEEKDDTSALEARPRAFPSQNGEREAGARLPIKGADGSLRLPDRPLEQPEAGPVKRAADAHEDEAGDAEDDRRGVGADSDEDDEEAAAAVAAPWAAQAQAPAAVSSSARRAASKNQLAALATEILENPEGQASAMPRARLLP